MGDLRQRVSQDTSFCDAVPGGLEGLLVFGKSAWASVAADGEGLRTSSNAVLDGSGVGALVVPLESRIVLVRWL